MYLPPQSALCKQCFPAFTYRAVLRCWLQVARESRISSVHVNFCSENEVAALTGVGYMHRKSLQYHWRNEDKNAAEPGTKVISVHSA
jgi:uncharacterized protein